MRLTIRFKLSALAVIAVVASMMMAALGYAMVSRLLDVLADTSTVRTAQANFLEADMMHDALRADVLAAILAGDSGDAKAKEEARSDLAAHSDRFRKVIEETRSLPLSPETRAALDGVSRELAAYTASAREIVALGLADPQKARGRLSDFQTVFERLEAENEKVSDLIGASAEAVRADAEEGAKTAQFGLLGGAGVASLVIFLLCLMTARSILRPLSAIQGAMQSLSEGRKDIVIPGNERRDEIGAMAASVEVFRRTALEAERLSEEQRRAQDAQIARAARVDNAVSRFEKAAGTVVAAVSRAAETMRANSAEVSGTAKDTAGRAATVANAAQHASANVQTVATATEELAAGVQEITRQVQESTGVVRGAVEQVGQTSTTMSELASNADRIGEVVGLINDIAAQTNLLALNATIEAARAGEAGKGFAVVASEVKSLATQTAKATEDIAQQMASVQSVVGSAVKAIADVSGTIGRMDGIASAIAAAVEEQDAATREIARSVQEAASGTQEVSTNITAVGAAADQAGRTASSLDSAAKELSEEAHRLEREVGTFLSEIKAA